MPRLMCRFALALCLIVVVAIGRVSVDAAIIDQYDPARHDRYSSGTTPNPTFFLKDFDLSGIGGTAVLITPRHFVTARHVSGSSFTATFRGNDGINRSYTSSDSSVLMTTYTEMGVTVTAASDIRVYTLPTDVDAQITPIPIAVGDVANFIGHELIVFGQGNQAGRNIIDSVDVATFTGQSSPSVNVIYTYDEGGINGGLGQDELGLVGGDSGNQGLIQVGNELALLGTNFGVFFPPMVGPRGQYFNFTTLLSPYVVDQINPIVAASGQSIRTINVTAVPEPSTWLLTSTIIAGAIVRSRRQKISRVNFTV